MGKSIALTSNNDFLVIDGITFFNYASLNDEALVNELLQYKEIFKQNKLSIHDLICKNGHMLKIALDRLGKKRFKNWYEAELSEKKSSIRNYINFFEAFEDHFPTIGKFRLVDLYKLAGKQCASFRAETLARIEQGTIASDKELVLEIRSKIAARKSEKKRVASDIDPRESREAIESAELTAIDWALDILTKYPAEIVTEVLTILEKVSIGRVMERHVERCAEVNGY